MIFKICKIFRTIREAWIKTKYISLAFVSDLSISKESGSRLTRHNSKDHATSNITEETKRKWSVRKVRRRPRSRPRNRHAIKETSIEDDVAKGISLSLFNISFFLNLV